MLHLCRALLVGGDFVQATAAVDTEYLKQGRPSLLNKEFGCSPDVLKELQQITAQVENGTMVFFPDKSFLDSDMPPGVWVKCGRQHNPKYLAVFNWTDEQATISLNLGDWARTMELHDFWDDSENVCRSGERLDMSPHASRLFILR